MKILSNILLCIATILLLSTVATASEVTGLNTFVAGEPAVAADVNANFTAVKAAVDDNNASMVDKQDLVTGSCAAGSSIRVINSDGSVTCQADTIGNGDITAVYSGSGLSGGGSGGAVTLSIPTGGITAAHIATNAVGSAEIGNNAVGAAEIIDGSVGSAEIANNAVGQSEIATNAVGSAEISSNAVGAAEIIDDSVGSAEIANNAVGSTEITANAVGQSEIATGAVGAAEIATGAVGSAEIANDSVTAGDIKGEAGLDYTSGTASYWAPGLTVCNTFTNIRSVTLVAPTAGYMVAMATGVIEAITVGQHVRVVIDDASGGSSYDTSFFHFYETSTTTGYQDFKDFAMQAVYTVTAGTSKTFYVKACRESTGLTSGYIDSDSFIVLFFPTKY